VECALDLRHAGPAAQAGDRAADGTRYFSIAQMVRRPWRRIRNAAAFCDRLGCEIRHAAKLVYATGMDLEKPRARRSASTAGFASAKTAAQRAEPPITRTLIWMRIRDGCRRLRLPMRASCEAHTVRRPCAGRDPTTDASCERDGGSSAS